jgi:peptidylamidoglycolate lyase
MIKKLIWFVGVVAVIAFAYYLFLSTKNGEGSDSDLTYDLVENWPDLPANIHLGNPTGLGLDTNQNIVVFHRADRYWPLVGSMPDQPIQKKTILVIDKNSGKLLNSWGENLFVMPHGLEVDHENNIWVTDVALHQVLKFSYDGKLLMKIGEAEVPGKDSLHLNRPTDIAVAKDGSFYVSDGYRNSRIIKFSPVGKYLFEWGKKGAGESEFNIPHSISLDSSGNVYVADRENNRIQVFDPAGKFIRQISHGSFGAMCAVAYKDSKLYAADDLSLLSLKHIGSDIFIFDTTGKVLTRFGRSGSYTAGTAWFHDLVIDSEENIYIGDILTNTIRKFRKVVKD